MATTTKSKVHNLFWGSTRFCLENAVDMLQKTMVDTFWKNKYSLIKKKCWFRQYRLDFLKIKYFMKVFFVLWCESPETVKICNCFSVFNVSVNGPHKSRPHDKLDEQQPDWTAQAFMVKTPKKKSQSATISQQFVL